MNNKILFIIIFFSISKYIYGLGADSKLTISILGLSSSKHTILINKGSEHKLKKGNHAKFSLPTGMVARGILVKLSPSRSVWSLYRFYKKEKIKKGISLKITISNPIQLTKDETKFLGIIGNDKKIGLKHKKPLIITKEGKKSVKNQSKLANHFAKSQKLIKPYVAKEYLSLEKTGEVKRDPLIDWKGVDEIESSNINSSIDYSNLH